MLSFRLTSLGAARLFLLALLLASSCANPLTEPSFRAEDNKARSVWVVNYGWHSALIIRRADISERVLPEVKDFTHADYLEFGWGDWDYYQSSDPGLGLALKAAFWSSGSVLHVTGIKGDPKDYFRGSEIIEIVLYDEALQRMIQFVSATFSRSNTAAPVEGRPGLSSNSRFYPALGKFHLFRTCNTWVAEALRVARLPINPSFAFTAGNLMSQLRQTGTVVRDPL